MNTKQVVGLGVVALTFWLVCLGIRGVALTAGRCWDCRYASK